MWQVTLPLHYILVAWPNSMSPAGGATHFWLSPMNLAHIQSQTQENWAREVTRKAVSASLGAHGSQSTAGNGCICPKGPMFPVSTVNFRPWWHWPPQKKVGHPAHRQAILEHFRVTLSSKVAVGISLGPGVIEPVKRGLCNSWGSMRHQDETPKPKSPAELCPQTVKCNG